MESRSFSSIGGGRPVQSAKLANLRSPGGLALSPAHHELHSAERAVGGAEEETEQQWEYRGYGIWDREPGDHQPQVGSQSLSLLLVSSLCLKDRKVCICNFGRCFGHCTRSVIWKVGRYQEWSSQGWSPRKVCILRFCHRTISLYMIP